MNILTKIIRYWDPFGFYKDHYKNLSEDEYKLCINDNSNSDLGIHLKNDTVKEGRVRLNLFFWNELNFKDEDSCIYIKTDRLDRNLYNDTAIEDIIKIGKDRIKILYENDSENIKKLFNVLGKDCFKKVSPDKKEAHYILGFNTISFELDQKYAPNDPDLLIEHKANFYFNVSSNNPSTSRKLRNKIKKHQEEFNEKWLQYQ